MSSFIHNGFKRSNKLHEDRTIDRRNLGGYRYLRWGFTGGDALGSMYDLDGAEYPEKEPPGRDLPVDLTGGETCVPRISKGEFPPFDTYIFLKSTNALPVEIFNIADGNDHIIPPQRS